MGQRLAAADSGVSPREASDWRSDDGSGAPFGGLCPCSHGAINAGERVSGFVVGLLAIWLHPRRRYAALSRPGGPEPASVSTFLDLFVWVGCLHVSAGKPHLNPSLVPSTNLVHRFAKPQASQAASPWPAFDLHQIDGVFRGTRSPLCAIELLQLKQIVEKLNHVYVYTGLQYVCTRPVRACKASF